jgi:branched-chain amino acid transport system permease protein
VIGGFGSIAGAVIGGYALGGLEVLLTALPGIGDILPPGLVAPGVQAFLKQWLPSSLSGYRDAFVFVALILMLLFRPNGILGKRGREEL